MPEGAPRRRGRHVTHDFVSAEAVYGTILIAGLIFAFAYHEAVSWGIFWAAASTVLVFWLAHVYAGTVANYGDVDGNTVGLRDALTRSLTQSGGLLVSSFIPLALLLLGVLGLVSDPVAIGLALWSAVVILAVLGYRAFKARGATLLACIGGAAATASFGVLMIVLKAIIH